MVPEFSEGQLSGAAASSDPAYKQLPEDAPERIRRLAIEITAAHPTTYGKARALSGYLSGTYTYGFAADSGKRRPPPGRDPVDWFLFEHLKGTCGNFSSAFVVMARSVGIPSRVVSGWVVDSTQENQTVYTDQAHQWAEVALDGIGWVTFESTAPGGASTRVTGGLIGGPGRPVSDEQLAQLKELVEDLSDQDASVREDALEALAELGDVTLLENGGGIVTEEGTPSWHGGTTTLQAPELAQVPVFNIRGATHTGYLRVAVGDTYENGRWRQLDPVSVPDTC